MSDSLTAVDVVEAKWRASALVINTEPELDCAIIFIAWTIQVLDASADSKFERSRVKTEGCPYTLNDLFDCWISYVKCVGQGWRAKVELVGEKEKLELWIATWIWIWKFHGLILVCGHGGTHAIRITEFSFPKLELCVIIGKRGAIFD